MQQIKCHQIIIGTFFTCQKLLRLTLGLYLLLAFRGNSYFDGDGFVYVRSRSASASTDPISDPFLPDPDWPVDAFEDFPMNGGSIPESRLSP